MKKLAVVTFKWGSKFSARHVNTLRAMVRRHLSLPHRFICITDDAEGLDEGVEVVPLWQEFARMGRCYRRLRLLDGSMRELLGERILHLDLDTVIVRDITPLAARPEPFVIWRSGSKGPHKFAMNPSILLMNAGAMSGIYRIFAADPAGVKARAKRAGWTGSDQAVLGFMLPADVPTFNKVDGTISFRDDSPNMRGRREMSGPRIIGFYGDFDPADRRLQGRHPWIARHWRSLRMDILDMLIDRFAWKRGAELGVLKGDTYFHLLERNPSLELLGVDAWRVGGGPLRRSDGYRSYAQHPLADYAASVKERAAAIGDRARVMHMDTIEAASEVPDRSLDFVFVDADHTEAAVRADILAWLPKLKPSGWMLGHDTHFPGVRDAIDDLLPGWRAWPDHVWSIERRAVR